MTRSISPPPGSLKPTQRGTILIGGAGTSQTATISPASSRAALRLLGFCTSGGVAPIGSDLPLLVLTNSTTVTASRTSAASGLTVTVSFELSDTN